MLLFIWVWMRGKVAGVIVGLSSAVKIPPSKKMDSSLCGCCLTKATIGHHKNLRIYHNKQQTRELGLESKVFGFHYLTDKISFNGNLKIVALSL